MISIRDLSHRYGRARSLEHVSLHMPSGVVCGFLGPNGAGKTTMIRLLLGLLEPTGGTAEVLGFDTQTQGEETRSQTGALLEHPGLYERLSARDNLERSGNPGFVLGQPLGQARVRSNATP